MRYNVGYKTLVGMVWLASGVDMREALRLTDDDLPHDALTWVIAQS